MAKVVGGLPPALDFMFGSFYRNFVSKKTLNHGIGPAINFTRESNATYFDASGTLQTAGTDAPRFDHSGGNSLGLLIEESRTNSLRNSQAGGAVVGAPGTLPTNWGYVGLGALSSEVVGTGTENGLTYVDIRIFGTSNTTSVSIVFETLTQIVASSGQTWTFSVWLKLQGGSLTNVSNVRTFIRGNTAGGTVVETLGTASVPTGSLIRYANTGTLADALTARVQSYINLTITNGATVDFTLRIAAPQLERGAFPTSYIPTTSAAATRAAESAVVAPISSFYNQVESTIFSELSATSVAFDSTILAINNNTQNEQIDQRLAITSVTMRARVGGVNQASMAGVSPVVAPVAGTVYKFVAAYKQDDFAASMDGATVVTDTSGNMPTGLSRMVIGSRTGSAFLTGHIRKLAYWPRRLSNTLLQQLTT